MIAHRTCPRHRAENSVAGIRLADELGADVVEIDVRGTRGLARVLMHDRCTRRTAGGLWVVSRTSLARVRARRLEQRADEEPSAPPPLLGEALAAVGARMGVAIELKDARIVSGALGDVREAGMADRTLLWSYSERVVSWFVRQAPEIEVALLRDTRTARQHRKLLDDAAALGARGVSIGWSALSADLAEEARRRGLSLYSLCPFRVPDPRSASLLDGVITDWPAEARAALEAPLPRDPQRAPS